MPNDRPGSTTSPSGHAELAGPAEDPPRRRLGRRYGRRRAALGAGALLTTAALAVSGCDGPRGGSAPDSPSGPGTSADGGRHGRGTLVSVTPLGKLDRSGVAEAADTVFPRTGTVRYGVSAYRLTYRTITPKGQPTTATGLLTLPRRGGSPRGASRRLTTVVHSHGTLSYRDDAPSTDPKGLDRTVSSLYASGGRAVVSADYLGLGKGPGRHPYLDVASEKTASLDMLRAARNAAPRLGGSLNGEAFSTGFSQGGQVAMAVGQALESQQGRGHWRLRGLAPVSGPYDIEHDMRTLDDAPTNKAAAAYVTFLLTAQNRLHHLYDSPKEVFRPPYDGYAEDLFDSDHRGAQTARKLPGSVRALLTHTWYERLTNPSGKLQKTLRRNDTTCDWAPSVPVRLYTASGDTDVPIANTRSCARQLAAHGVRARVTDQGDVDHFGAFRRSVPAIARWVAGGGSK